MNKKLIIIILLIAITISAFTVSEGFIKKVKNEDNNNTLITAFDYKNFVSKGKLNDQDMEEIANELKESGVNSVLLREISLFDLKVTGDIYYEYSGYYLSSLNKIDIGKARQIKAEIGLEEINPYTILITTMYSEIDELLTERFSKRFNIDDYKRFQIDDVYYYYIYNTMETENVTIGFNEKLMEKLYKKGFQIVLMPYNNNYRNYLFIDEYEDLIKKYNIRNVVFETGTIPGYPDDLDRIVKLFNDNNIITALMERFDQIMYAPQRGIEDIIKNTNNRMARAYYVQDYDLVKSDSERLASLYLRAIMDRSIRIVVFQQTSLPKLSFVGNFENTLEAIKMLNSDLKKYNFDMDKQLEAMSNDKASTFHEIFIIILLSLLILLYLLMLSFKNLKYKIILSTGFMIFLILIKLSHIISVTPILSLCGAIIIPGIATLTILKALKVNFKKFTYIKYLFLPIIALGICLFGGYLINTIQYEMEYLNNIALFRGVKIAFLVPFILYTINFSVCFLDFKSTSKLVIDFAKEKVTYLALMLIGLGGALAFIYLARSGNSFSFLVSGFELKVRTVLEELFYMRPRFKEFLLGYPGLVLSIYIYEKYKSKISIFILGLLVTSLAVSIVNTFSHGASAFKMSLARSVNGLIFGLAFSALALISFTALEKLFFYTKSKVLKYYE